MAAAAPERPRLPRAVYAIGLTSLLNDAATEMIFPLLPLFLVAELGAGAVALGVIEGAADAAASLLKLVSGRASDRMQRRKPFVVAGYLLASAVRPLMSLAGSAAHILVVRVVDRVGKGLRASPRDALLASAAPAAQHGQAFGVHEAMDHAGAVLGGLIAFALMQAGVSLRAIFALSAVPALGACLLAVTAVQEAPAEAAPHVRPPGAGETAWLGRPFAALLAASLLFALGNSSDGFLLLRVRDAGLPAAVLPLLWAVHHSVKAVASREGGRLADRFGRRRALAAGWLVYAGIYAGFARAGSLGSMTALFIAYGLYFGLTGGAQKALVAELVPAAARGRAFGLFHMATGLAALPASALFGGLYQTFGPLVAFTTGGILSALAAVLLPLSRPARRI